MKNKTLIFLCLILLFLSISCVSASEDTNQTLSFNQDTATLSIDDGAGADTVILTASLNSTMENDNVQEDLSENENILTAAGGGQLYVNSTHQDGDGKTPDTAFATLKKALDESEDGDTINIASGTYTGNGENVNLTIDKKINLIGYGDGEVLFDAQAAYRIFEITATCINITGLTFKNGRAETGGALYFVNPISYSNINANFSDNEATSSSFSGGAIAFKTSVSNSSINGTFTYNKANYHAGAIYFAETVSDLSITGTYTYNKASNYGGAIYFEGTVSDLSITGTFTYNKAGWNGGANSFAKEVSNSTISGTFTYNKAGYYGGANAFNNEVYNSTVSGTYVNNTADDGGANIFIRKVSNLNITGEFTNNNASGFGGANKFNSEVSNSSINGTFAKNKAKSSGGANYFANPVYDSVITGTFANHTAGYSGGANYFENQVSNSTISGTYDNNSAKSSGGANYFNNELSSSNISGTFTNNNASKIGGANYFNKGVSGSNITGTFSNNNASFGGANYFNQKVSGSNISGTFSNNNASRFGGANGFGGNVINSDVGGKYSNNKAAYGGAIAVNGTSSRKSVVNMTINKSSFEDMEATSDGGSIYVEYAEGNLTVKDSNFDKSYAGGNGGAIHVNNLARENGLNLVIEGSTITNSNASYDAAAIYISNSNAEITDSIIEDNAGVDKTLPAIYVSGGTLDISCSSLVNDLSVETGRDTKATLNNNWWGSNDPKDDAIGTDITMDNWVIMMVTADRVEAVPGEKVTLTVDFSHVNTTSGEIQKLTRAIPKNHTVTFSCNSTDEISPETLVIQNGNNKTATYTVHDIYGQVSIRSDDAVVMMTFTPKDLPYYGIIYVSKDGNDANKGSKDAPVATVGKAIEYATREGGSGKIIINEGTYEVEGYDVSGNLTITGNGTVVLDANGYDGVIFNISSDEAGKFELNNLTLTNANVDATGVVYKYAEGDLILNNVNITNCNGAVAGGIVKANGCNVTIVNSVISECAAGRIVYLSSGYGAAISATFVNTTFKDNIAFIDDGSSLGQGYAIIDISSTKDGTTLNLTDCHFINNTGKLGTVYTSSNEKVSMAVKGTEFINNTVLVGNGGAINAWIMTVDDSTFINNSVVNTLGRNGGAITVGYNGNAVITHSKFENNSATDEGNTIYSSGALTVNYCSIIDNTPGNVIYQSESNDLDVQYNWWGTNDDPSSLINDGTIPNWVVMNVANNLTSDRINIKDKIGFTVDFKHYNDTTDTLNELDEPIPEVEVWASALKGEFDKQKATTENNIVIFEYSPKETGKETITICSTKAINITSFDVYDHIELIVTKTVDKDKVANNTPVNYTIVVRNAGPDNATEVIVTDLLPGELVYNDWGIINSNGAEITKLTNQNKWNISNITSDNEVSIWVAAITAGTGTVTNNVTVISRESETEVKGNATIEVVPVELAIKKTADADVIGVWESVTFTINVTNTAMLKATNIIVTDIIPDGFTFIESNATEYDEDTGVLKIPVLEAGESYAFTITLNATANGTLSNEANVICHENNNPVSDSADVVVKPAVRLSVTKTVDYDHAVIGDIITFTVTVTNNGPSNATNIRITDVCGSGLEFIDGNLTDNIEFLKNGESVSFTIKYIARTFGNYTNYVNITCDQNASVISANASVKVVVTDIKITQTVNVSSVYVDDGLFNFTIHIRNHGEPTATYVNITDSLDDAFTIIDAKGPYTEVLNVIVWNVGSLASEEEYEVWVVAKAKTHGNFTNTAFVNCKEDPTLEESTVEVEVKPVVNLNVEKSVNVPEGTVIEIGDEVVFTINVTNKGPSDATGVIVTDIVQEGFKFISSTADAYDETSGLLAIDLIKSGESYVFNITMEVLKEGISTNYVNVTCKENDTLASDSASIEACSIDLTIGNDASADVIANNTEITFTIVVNNPSQFTATDVIVNDVLPDGLEFISSNVNPDEIKDNTYTWIIPTLANGTAKTIDIKVRSKETGIWINVANVTCKQNPDVISAYAEVEVIPVELDVIKVADALVVGNNSLVNFTIVIRNVGDADATGVVVYDELPSGLVFVAASEGYDKSTHSWTCDLASDSVARYWIQAKAVELGNLTNTASVNCNENKTLVQDSDTVDVVSVKTETVTLVENITAMEGACVTINVTVKTIDGAYVNAGEVEVFFDGDSVATIPVIDGEAIKEITLSMEAGIYDMVAKYTDSSGVFDDSEASAVLNVTPKKDANLNIEDISVDENDYVTITATFDEGVTGNVTFTVTGEKTNFTDVVPVKDGKAVCTISGLPVGNYTVLAEVECEGYYPDYAVDTFSINKKDSDLVVYAEVDDEGIVRIYATADGDATGNVTFIVLTSDNETFLEFDKELIDGIANEGATYEFDEGKWTVIAKYAGDDKFNAGEDETAFEITKKQSNFTIEDIAIDDDNKVTITATVDDDVTGNVTFTVTGDKTNYTEVVPVKDGKAVCTISDLPIGNYTVLAELECEGYYPDYAVDTFSINKKDSDLAVYAEVDDEGIVRIYATADGDATGNVTFIVLTSDNETFLEFDKELIDGIANEGATYEFDEGKWTVIAKYAGDDKFIAGEDETAFEITKRQSNLTIEDIAIDDDHKVSITATVDEGVGGNMTFTVTDGKSTYSTIIPIENGTAVCNIPAPLKNGNYTVSVRFNGDNETYMAHIESNFTVAYKTATGLITPNRVIYVSDAVEGYIYQIILKDEKDTHLAFEEVTFTFNGVTRSAITDADGWAEFNFTANAEGSYSIEVSYAGSNDYKAVSQNGTIKLVKGNVKFLAPNRVIYASDLTKGYTYQVILKSKDGKALENRKVLIILNGKKYLAITDENGYATFNLTTNNAGVYNLTIRFAGDRYYNAFEDYRTLKAIKEPVYLFTKTEYFNVDDTNKQVSATIQSKTGKPVSNEKVTLKVNGVTYAATTNSNGVALMKISLDKKGTFATDWQFGGTNVYNTRSATSKIVVS